MGLKALLTGKYKPPMQNLGVVPNGFYPAIYRDGAFQQEITVGMLAYTNQSELLPEYTRHEVNDAYWASSQRSDGEWSEIRWPAVIWAGWYDIFQRDTLQVFKDCSSKSTRCVSLCLVVSRCVSLCLCVPLCLAVSRCVSLCLAMSRCVSLCLAVSLCLSLCLAAAQSSCPACSSAVCHRPSRDRTPYSSPYRSDWEVHRCPAS